jgi:hypothetical protein
MNRNVLETTNRRKTRGESEELVKNTSITHELIQTPNTGGHEVVRATIPSKIHGSYTNWGISGSLSHKHLEEGKP